MNIGILGGTFDPPHSGHLSLAAAALASGFVDKILLMTAHCPPHKTREISTPSETRHAMATRLAANLAGVEACDLELRLAGVSYTWRTVQELQRLRPDDNFRLIIGADMALIFDTWKFTAELIKHAPPLIAARPGFSFPPEFGTDLPLGLTPEERAVLASGMVGIAEKNISSSYLRGQIASGAGREFLLQYMPENVTDYILLARVYG